MRCIFSSCNHNDSGYISSQETAYFKFPTEPLLRNVWLEALHKNDWQPDADSAVCSKHFLSNDLVKNKNGLLKLREGAVPVVNVKVCRICLAIDCQLYPMATYKILYEAYETVTGLLIEIKDNLPLYVCKECAHQLLTCTQFRTKSLETHSILLEIYKKHNCITLETIQSVHGIQNLLSSSINNESNLFDIDMEVTEIGNEETDINSVLNLHEEFSIDCVKIEDQNHNNVTEELGNNDEMSEGIFENIVDESTQAKEESAEQNPAIVKEITSAPDNFSPIKQPTIRQPEAEGRPLECGKFSCDICNFQTNIDVQLTSHLKAHAAPKAYNCEICNYKTIYKRSLTWHLRVHSGDKPYACDKCNKTFVKKSYLQFHIREHMGEKLYFCDICNKGFSRKDCLKVHLKAHSGEKPYSCHLCSKVYGDKGNLKKHLQVHCINKNYRTDVLLEDSENKSNKKPYQCDLCNKIYIRKSSFDKHFRKHFDENLYSCHACNQAFTIKSKLETHLKAHHGEKLYPCKMCDKVFLRKCILVKHNMRQHSGGESYSCHICYKTFANKEYLKSHVQIHLVKKLYQCKVCNKEFMKKSYLRKHMRHHSSDKPYNCDVCNKSFLTKDYIKVHLRTHTGEKPYSCNVCKKTFAKKYHLNKHTKIHF